MHPCLIYLKIYLNHKGKKLEMFGMRHFAIPSRRPPRRAADTAARAVITAMAGRHGRTAVRLRRRHDARRTHAGAGRPSPAGARPDRRATAPRLRDHQGARGEDPGLVRAEPGHRLSDADLSRRKPATSPRRRTERSGSTASPAKAARTWKATAHSSMQCWTGSTRSASACARAAAMRITTAGGDRRVSRLVQAALENLRDVAASERSSGGATHLKRARKPRLVRRCWRAAASPRFLEENQRVTISARPIGQGSAPGRRGPPP